MTVTEATYYRKQAYAVLMAATDPQEVERAAKVHTMWNRIVTRKVEQERAAARRATPEPLDVNTAAV